MRPKELADDYTGTNDVVKHCLEWLIGQGDHIQYVCCIYATAPFLQTKYLKRGFDILKQKDCDFTFSVTEFSFPIQRSIKIRLDGCIEPFFPEHVPKRSQDLEQAYHDAAQFYWGKAESFLKQKIMYSPVSKPVILPRSVVQDIDTPEDWKIAELMYRAMLLE